MTDKNFSLRQSVYDFAFESYGTRPEYLWQRYPSFGVLRCSKNKKWYGVIMNIQKSKLGLKQSGSIDVINVKTEPMMVGTLIMEKGFFPAYHMAKGSWVTVALDGSVSKELVFDMLRHSYELIEMSR